MLVGTTVNRVSAPPINAPFRATLGFLAANILSIKSNATMSPNPNARIAPQLIKAPLAMSYRPERSINSGGALLYMVSHGTAEKSPAKKIKPAQKAPIAR